MQTTMNIERSPSYAANRWKADRMSGPTAKGEACVLCGLPCPNPRYFVEMVNGGGEIAIPGAADANDPGYVGCQPIGADCLRKHPEYKPFVVDAKGGRIEP